MLKSLERTPQMPRADSLFQRHSWLTFWTMLIQDKTVERSSFSSIRNKVLQKFVLPKSSRPQLTSCWYEKVTKPHGQSWMIVLMLKFKKRFREMGVPPVIIHFRWFPNPYIFLATPVIIHFRCGWDFPVNQPAMGGTPLTSWKASGPGQRKHIGRPQRIAGRTLRHGPKMER